MPELQRAWIINHYAKGALKGTELALVEQPIPYLRDGEVQIRTRLLSLDPSNLLWLTDKEDYLPQLQLGEVMRGLVLGQVEQSRHPDFEPGNYLFAKLGWQEVCVIHGDRLSPADGAVKLAINPQIPLDAYVSALGLTGWTAHIGMKTLGHVSAKDQVLVSGAAGATGSMACQIAKAAGARVVGIAGGADKCSYLSDELGVDSCIDYRATDNLSQAIAKACPDGVDLFFDNIGGPTLDAALENMAIGGRIMISGSLSQYANLSDPTQLYGLRNSFLLASRRLRMQGFLVLDYLDQLDQILPALERGYLDGKIRFQNSYVEGLEQAQAALPRLFSGEHQGKLVVRFD